MSSDQFEYHTEKQKAAKIEAAVSQGVEPTKAEKSQFYDYMVNLLKMMVSKKGSDLFITAGFPPAMKLNGVMTPLTDQQLQPEHAKLLVKSIMTDLALEEYERTGECNFAIAVPNLARFRVNVFTQQGCAGMVLRVINTVIPDLNSLGVPPTLSKVIMEKRGLIIVVGATGSGKSTTLAGMIDHRNANQAGHIITIEDPIEFVHKHKKSIVTQREVGTDTESFEVALKNTLRQAPDVILIGEIRDKHTMEYAIAFAETGHLCLATLHANNANQALDRIINFFPQEKRHQLLMDLSLNLKSIVSQRLVPAVKGGRVPAVEILLNSPYIADLIFKGEVGIIKEAMENARELGMQTFDQALFDLYEDHIISYEDALRNADSLTNLNLAIKLKSQRGLPKESVENNNTKTLKVMD